MAVGEAGAGAAGSVTGVLPDFTLRWRPTHLDVRACIPAYEMREAAEVGLFTATPGEGTSRCPTVVSGTGTGERDDVAREEKGLQACGQEQEKRVMARAAVHKWVFRTRFRRRAFGWKSQPAIKRVREAASEIKKVARKDKVLAAQGAVLFLEKVSPALEHVDSSSGAIGTAVNRAVTALADIIATAPVDDKTRAEWLERLFEAHADDQIPYIEILAEYWGKICASTEIASQWADRLIGTTKQALSQDSNLRGYFHGTSPCARVVVASADNVRPLMMERGRTVQCPAQGIVR